MVRITGRFCAHTSLEASKLRVEPCSITKTRPAQGATVVAFGADSRAGDGLEQVRTRGIPADLATVYATPPFSPSASRARCELGALDCWNVDHHVMEQQHDPSRNQYESFSAQQTPQRTSSQAPADYGSQAGAGQYRQQSLMQPPPRPSGDAQQLYEFSPDTQYGSASNFQPTPYAQPMQGQTTQRQHAQQYVRYAPSVMYGVPEPQAQQVTPMPYEQLQQFRQRPSAAPETYPTAFGVAQSDQVYLPNQSDPTGMGGAADISVQRPPPHYQQSVYAQPGPSSHQTYPTAMLDTASSTAYPAYGQPQQSTAQVADQGFNEYQSRIRAIFSFVQTGVLREAAPLLRRVSTYLLGNVENLGLTRDDAELHDDRIRLWDEFNRAWLTTLQQQYNESRDRTQVRESSSILDKATLEDLGRELVHLCDGIEKHGLVDYQMGVAEEEIMDLLVKCLSLLEPPAGASAELRGVQAVSSAAGAAHGP